MSNYHALRSGVCRLANCWFKRGNVPPEEPSRSLSAVAANTPSEAAKRKSAAVCMASEEWRPCGHSEHEEHDEEEEIKLEEVHRRVGGQSIRGWREVKVKRRQQVDLSSFSTREWARECEAPEAQGGAMEIGGAPLEVTTTLPSRLVLGDVEIGPENNSKIEVDFSEFNAGASNEPVGLLWANGGLHMGTGDMRQVETYQRELPEWREDHYHPSTCPQGHSKVTRFYSEPDAHGEGETVGGILAISRTSMAIDDMCATTGDPREPAMSTMGHVIDLGSSPECNQSNEIQLRDLGKSHATPAVDGVAANGNSIRLGEHSGITSVPLQLKGTLTSPHVDLVGLTGRPLHMPKSGPYADENYMAIWGLNASDVAYPGTKEKLLGTPLDPGEALARFCREVLDMESSGNLVRISMAVTSEIDIKVHPPHRSSKLDLKYGSMALFQADSSVLQCYNSARPPGDHPVTSWASAAA